MAPNVYPLIPHSTHEPGSIRRIYIQNLTDLLHVCLLRGEVARARRAWSILIRCREVDWRSRWYWGLEILNASSAQPDSQARVRLDGADEDGREAERWLKSLRVSAKEADKPALLHALVLHLIKHNRHRTALDELETYLSSYPYLLSGALHTYAGLLAFYLAQAQSMRRPVTQGAAVQGWNGSEPSGHSLDSRSQTRSVSVQPQTQPQPDPPNPILIRQARGWFGKALEIDALDAVAHEFIATIDRPWREHSDEAGWDDDSLQRVGDGDNSDNSDKETSDEEDGASHASMAEE